MRYVGARDMGSMIFMEEELACAEHVHLSIPLRKTWSDNATSSRLPDSFPQHSLATRHRGSPSES